MSTFDQLPHLIQQAILGANTHKNAHDYDGVDFVQDQAVEHANLWVAPDLCYDFHESNYSIFLVNLNSVAKLNVGPAMATLYAKADATQPAWIIVDPDHGDTDFQIFECI